MTQEVTLAMIVKNEEAVITRCLDSVLPHVVRAVVNDNGSTDRTPAILAERLVETVHSPWWDFATNRNLVLKKASEYGGYVLCGLDADEELVVPEGWTWPELTLDAYSIQCHYGSLRYPRMALVRADVAFYWQGVIHEALMCSTAFTRDVLPGVYIQVHSDGARAQTPGTMERDLVTLQMALKQEPTNSRYQFYLAQTLKDIGRFAEAREAYRKRVEMGGWPDETAYAEYMIGHICTLMGDEDPVPHLLNAYMWNPTRAEPLGKLAWYHRSKSEFALAVVYAEAAFKLPVPSSALFVEPDAYGWRALEEIVISAYYVPALRDRGAQAAALLLDRLPTVPAVDRDRVRSNCEFYTRM